IEPIPVNLSFIDLAQAINLPKSSIWIPKTHKNNDNYAWINGFASKEEADKFVLEWSGSSIFGVTVKCEVNQRRSDRKDTFHPSRQVTMSPIAQSSNKGNQDRRDEYNPTTTRVLRRPNITGEVPDSTTEPKPYLSHRNPNRTPDNEKQQQMCRQTQKSGK
ncbi:unnamed protein product, partial [Rotaria sp. Silwood2]